jgi:hypothetical protein
MLAKTYHHKLIKGKSLWKTKTKDSREWTMSLGNKIQDLSATWNLTLALR